MVKIITLSRDKERNVRTIEATFSVDGELVPLKVVESDKPEVFNEINEILQRPELNFDLVSQELYELMSPEARVKQHINDSYYLSGSLTIGNGKIFFGDEELEETLANHMLSLLNETNAPKDEKMWRSYIKFLDNLFQNANKDIREQLFRWMEYENRAGNAFAISDDGCLIGYKGCVGTVLEPMSKFSGNAIVDGVEFSGSIPNKVGSVIQMPRSAVQCDPSIGCSYGLHVGTRDYAVSWAPVLILVKVNPRDVVSVPYECDSQKMRVCEYTVLKVTDASEEHRVYYDSYEGNLCDEDNVLSESEAYDLLGSMLQVEYEGTSLIGELVDVYTDDLTFIALDYGDGVEHIELSSITDYEIAEDNEVEYVLTADDAVELMDNATKILIVKDDEDETEYEGVISNVYLKVGSKPGVIFLDDKKGYRHIKLEDVVLWETIENYKCPDCSSDCIAYCEEENKDSCDEYSEVYDLPLGTEVVAVVNSHNGLSSVKGEIIAIVKDEKFVVILDENNSVSKVSLDTLVSMKF